MTVARAVANISPVLSYYSAVQLIIYKRVLFMATVMVNYYLLDYVSIARQRPFDGRGLEAGFSSLSTYYYFFFLSFSFIYVSSPRKKKSKLRVLHIPDTRFEKKTLVNDLCNY